MTTIEDVTGMLLGVIAGLAILAILWSCGESETTWGNGQWDDAKERRNGDS